jgi:hypothetical protein
MKGKKRQAACARRRAAKESRMAKNDGHGSSKYAAKYALKMGGGKRQLGWVWWTEGDTPREIQVT